MDELVLEILEGYLASLRLPACTLLMSSPRVATDMSHDYKITASGPDE